MTYQTYLKNRNNYLEQIDEDEVKRELNEAFYQATQSGDADIIYKTERVLSTLRDAQENKKVSMEQLVIYEAHHSFSQMTKTLFRF